MENVIVIARAVMAGMTANGASSALVHNKQMGNVLDGYSGFVGWRSEPVLWETGRLEINVYNHHERRTLEPPRNSKRCTSKGVLLLLLNGGRGGANALPA